MRLINANTLRFEDFVGDPPPYLILSHTWEPNEEVTFQDMSHPYLPTKRGYSKITETCRLALEKGIGYAWIDTCCIDKSSSAELSESINSMFKWYQRAEICVVYLADLKCTVEFEQGIKDCRWVTRGWTLQELIAPKHLEFYDEEWTFRGNKFKYCGDLWKATGVPEGVLRMEMKVSNYSVAQRMSWASKRTTTRLEDESYCLFGILEVNIPLMYGEGDMAFCRLQEEVIKRNNDYSIFAWNPTSNENLHRYCSMLASSPSDFKDGGNILVANISSLNPEFALTNKGLQFEEALHLAPTTDTSVCTTGPQGQGAEYILMVGAVWAGGEHREVGIKLTKVGPSLFLRVPSIKIRQVSARDIKSWARTRRGRWYVVNNLRLNTLTLFEFLRSGIHVPPGHGFQIMKTIPWEYWNHENSAQFLTPTTNVNAFSFRARIGMEHVDFTVLVEYANDGFLPIIFESTKRPAIANYIFQNRASDDVLLWESLKRDYPELANLSATSEISVKGGQFRVMVRMSTWKKDAFGLTIKGYSLKFEVVKASDHHSNACILDQSHFSHGAEKHERSEPPTSKRDWVIEGKPPHTVSKTWNDQERISLSRLFERVEEAT
ncbi:heterokaryon incompatibility protein-domain-containing protein [Triangularia verruculosa]|uniref:Heterokaryon incompatibility protein-domain-containing protein n=1 Tax=Triangularia verruculosa TaxID=2587418 RepID=A0AAN6XBX6_9PEZI|nr:heterokaryon incompatibility protein-domain-containing protein [Triangularia verruculosa]